MELRRRSFGTAAGGCSAPACQNAPRPLALLLRSIAAPRERRRFHSGRALRCVSKHCQAPRSAAGVPWRGRLASRRSTVAVLGSGAALLSPAFAPDRLQRAPRTQVVMPGGRGPEPPGANGYEPPPQDATPRSAFRIVSRTRPQVARLTSVLLNFIS